MLLSIPKYPSRVPFLRNFIQAGLVEFLSTHNISAVVPATDKLEAFIPPLTSSFVDGEAVPIPTLPIEDKRVFVPSV